ncbi:BTAD domain-containing putative transcriptional regulator [Streptomyces sp. cmx-18-6]|uniref:BTAD domain-containing putative transcriptional regulator n=1 Tax=Streptomyces sp. cmx-18-6 TaxID=2790930 RepID=UPI00397F1923
MSVSMSESESEEDGSGGAGPECVAAATGLPRGGAGERSPFGSRLQAFRRRAGLSQEVAAARAGISTRALRDIERDRVRRPQSRTLQRLADALGLGDAELADLVAAARTGPPRGAGRPRLLILGPLALQRDGAPVPVTSPMLRRLLGLLALKHPEPATQQEITDTLWPAGPPGSHQSLVHTYVSQVRRLLEPGGPDAGPRAGVRTGMGTGPTTGVRSGFGAGPRAGLRAGPQPTVARTPTGYLLEASRSQFDLGHFDELLDRAERLHRAPDPEAAYASLTQALRWWRGPVLADADPVLSRHPAAVVANERRVRAVLLHADTALLLRRPEEAVPVLWDMVNAEPLHEGLHARLILALASCGEQAAALNVFSRLRDRLDGDLGIAPSAEVRDAHLRVLRQQLPLPQQQLPLPQQQLPVVGAQLPSAQRHPAPAREQQRLEGPASADRTPLTTPSPQPHPQPPLSPAQLPARAGVYVGRQRQLEVLDVLVSADPARRARMVAVVGAPGVGKTALATHWAHTRREHFEDGQLFVDLRGHSPLPALRPGDVLAQFLRALGVPTGRLPADVDEAAALYRTLLADRRMLIVLDNVRDAEQVRPLIPGAQGCAVVITSRSQLAGLVSNDGARRIGLDVLDPDEARRLLGTIIGECRVAAEEEAARSLVRVCGGLPLAIRIAGANMVARTGGIADHCAGRAGDEILNWLHIEGDRRSTVRSAFGLSYGVLPPPAQRMFRLLSLTPGPDLSADAAAALAGSTPAEAAALLVTLADAHLVREGAVGRFGLHDLLRTYARGLAGEEEAHAARQRLFDWYLHRTEAAVRLLHPAELPAAPAALAFPVRPAFPAIPAFPDRVQAVRWLDSERENLAGAVLQAAGTGFTTTAWRLAESLHRHLSAGSYTGDRLKAATAGLFVAVADGELRSYAADAQALELFGGALDLARRSGWLDGQTLALRRLARCGSGVGPADDVTNLGLTC